ncbi:hypothetical protein [Aquisediminimonas sediminicola]|uniref:hypothetical protein n=1 Tax=Alteraquisediminimonas sediminicola TaxID=2676787 RepID=UPI001C8EFD7C|nr:hypothetical protein [Aquisediminimonas sediminicola]
MRAHHPLLAMFALLWPSMAMADAPHDIQGNLRLWLDGLDVNGTDTGNGGGSNPTNGAQVKAWKDKSANAFTAGDAVSNTTRTFPTYNESSGVSFNGVRDILEIPGGIFPSGVGVSASEILIIATTRTIAALPILLSNGNAGGSGTNRYLVSLPWNDGNIYWDHGNLNAGRVSVSWSGTNSALDRVYLYNFNASSPISIARDGSTIASSSNTGTYTPASNHFFNIGGGEGDSNRHHDGIVSELIVYSRKLKTAERNIIQSYLAAKHANPGGAGSLNRYTNSAGYRYHVGGIGQESDGSLTTGTSAGLTITNTSFLANGNYVLAGLSALSPTTGTTSADAPTGFNARSQRIWFLNRTGTGTGAISLSFKLSDLGVTATNGQRLALLSRSATTGTFTMLATTNYAGGGTASFSISDPQNGYYALALEPMPVVTASLNHIVQSDGINSSNFKAIPNALIKASANMTNSGPGSPDSNSTTLTIPVPANMTFFVGDIATVGGGPVKFNQGSPTSGLTYSYTVLGNSSDGLEFSNDSGATWTYTPVPDGQQGDTHITHVRIKPSGSFATSTASPFPNFTVDYGLLVK